ncbi:MAG TPA: PQQ-binding-like beta-propeller repeat protein, partial [Verrucomicrobiae bacterium]
DAGQPLDPDKVAEQVQNLKLPARIALPALLGNASYEQQLEAALNDNPQHPRPQVAKTAPIGAESVRMVPGENGLARLTTRLLKENFVTREAMKAPPKTSALNGNLNASQTGDVANEMLNEMQRNRGGDKVTEDESTYQVIVHLLNSPGTADWTGEVTGPPQLFVLQTVNIVAAGKTVIVLDKSNKKLWQAALTYDVSGGGEHLPGEQPQFGDGPVVEHGGTLYVIDQAVLSAYDLSTGNARWRVPSVGVVGLFFNDAGDVYVNTTTGNPDDIKYSRQIDINKNTEDVLLKINAKNGEILWRAKPGGFISYLSGKFIYTVQSFDPNPTDEDQLSDMTLQSPALLRIKRINPKDGRVLWDYERDSCPVDVQFKDNTIELIFKRTVQVLKYVTF